MIINFSCFFFVLSDRNRNVKYLEIYRKSDEHILFRINGSKVWNTQEAKEKEKWTNPTKNSWSECIKNEFKVLLMIEPWTMQLQNGGAKNNSHRLSSANACEFKFRLTVLLFLQVAGEACSHHDGAVLLLPILWLQQFSDEPTQRQQ